jgi:hypothetical protein
MNEQPTDHVPIRESGVDTPGGMVVLTPLAQHYLDQTRPWVRFVSVLTFVVAGFMALAGVIMLLVALFGGFAARSAGGLGLRGAVGGAVLACFYLVLASVYIAPGVYLARYASAIERLRATGNAGVLEDALKHQKSLWRFVGIVTAISLAVAVVGMVLAIGVGVIAAVMAARS